MTAEIAIVNRSAITLAADSAMTVSVNGRRKIYASSDKIFELSEKDAVGVMIYNNLEFMGAPIEVLIKQFRASPHCIAVDHLSECSTVFFDYLLREWMPSVPVEKRHVRDLILPIYSKVMRRFERHVRTLFSATTRKKMPFLPRILLDFVNDEIEALGQYPIAECFSDMTEEQLLDLYKDVIDDVIGRTFNAPAFEDKATAICRRLGVLALHREVFSSGLTGFVFAGFGRNEVFPSLRAYHVDGIIAGKLKAKVTNVVTTSREQVSAKVIPFAQREVVDRFLVGIDPELQDGIKEYLDKLRREAEGRLFAGAGRLASKTKEKIRNNLALSLGLSVDNFDDWLAKIKDRYSKETEDMVLFMAKQESAHLAESLVNITSLKRKYSPDEESVAGPIDVAVISKSDGFVWVKRKHYFGPELNQRYFVRKFGGTVPGKGGGNAA
jgi:hypothetical protein